MDLVVHPAVHLAESVFLRALVEDLQDTDFSVECKRGACAGNTGDEVFLQEGDTDEW
jgi:hypothetical protein